MTNPDDTTDRTPARAGSIPAGLRSRLDALDALDDLMEEVTQAEADGGLSPTSRDKYDGAFRRYESWCLDRGWDPYEASLARVGLFVVSELAPCGASHVRGTVRGITRRWRLDRGHPRVVVGRDTFAGRLALGVARTQVAPRRGKVQTPGAGDWAQLLAVPKPDPDDRAAECRAALLTAWHTGLPFSVRTLTSVVPDSVTVADDGSEVGLVVGDERWRMEATGDADCPVAAWEQLLDARWSGWPPGQDGTPSPATSVVAEVRRITSAPALGLPALPGARAKVAADVVLDRDALLRVCWLADLDQMLWLRDQVVLLWQLLGGYRPSTQRKLLRGTHVRVTTCDERGEALTVAFGGHKGNVTNSREDTNSMPALPDHPGLCVVSLTRIWWWLMGVRDGDPVFPTASHRTIYSRSRHRVTKKSCCSSVFSASIKRRAEHLGWDTDLLASTSGRHSLATEAVAAGLDLIAVADHIGHAALRSTLHYVAASSRRAAARSVATAVTAQTPAEFR